MTGALAALRDVDVTFAGGVQALRGVTLRIPHGDMLGLVGESGSGKTTLCRVLLGLARPDAGDVLFEGAPVAEHLARRPSAFRRAVQMLLQDAVGALDPRMRIDRALEEPLHIHGLPLPQGRARIGELLDRLGLPRSVLRRYPHQVSGGQARRIGLARALLVGPRLVIADEPTAGLDVSVQGDLLNLLVALRRDLGLTWLLVSHNLGVVRRVCDRVAVMYLGEIVEEAPATALFARPAHPYAAALLSTEPAFGVPRARRRIVLAGEIPSARRPPSGCRFHTRCPVAQPRCAAEAPALVATGPDRSARCHFPFSLRLEVAAA